jgi:prepilin-type N-terminal cleavage/methylation domain-containing protein
MNRKTNIHFRAFTMIELLIVVAILGITASVVFTNSSGSRTTQYLDNAGREVEAVIHQAQNAALTGVQLTSGDRPCGYRVTWAAGSAYSVMYRYKNGSGVCNQSSTLSTHTLQNGVVFDNDGTVEFTLPHGTVAAPATIRLARQGVFQMVCVSAAGRIVTVSGSVCPP